MALAIDASTPALASGSTAAITSASFTTPASVLLVAFVGRDSASAGIDSTGTVSGAGLTWTLAGRKSAVGTGQVAGGTAQPGCAEIWWAYSDTALTSVTVTDTRTSGADDHAMQVMVITGAESTWGGGIAANGAASGLPTATLTTTAAGSWVMACSTDWSARGNATAGSGQTIISQFHLASQISIHFWRQTTTTATSGTSVTNNLTAPTAEQYNMLSIEVRAASSGGTSLTASPADSLPLTDDASAAADRSRSQDDLLGLSDTASATADRAPSTSDALGFTDALSAGFDRASTAGDPLGLSDALSAAWDRATTVGDALGLTDSAGAARTGATSSSVADPLGLSDALTVSWDRAATLGDPLGLTDAPGKSQSGTGNAAPSDPLALTDSVSVLWQRVTTVSDLLGLTDAASTSQANDTTKAPADPLGFTDVTSPVFGRDRTPGDALGMSDSVVAVLDRAVTITDTLGLADQATVTFVGDPSGFVDVRVLSVVDRSRTVTLTDRSRTVTVTEHPRTVTITDRS